jgi:hypothetical protein
VPKANKAFKEFKVRKDHKVPLEQREVTGILM